MTTSVGSPLLQSEGVRSQHNGTCGSDIPLTAPSVYVKDTGTVKGRGVFALRDFEAGEVVETCPVVLMRLPFGELPKELRERVFDWGALAGAPPGTHARAHGYGSLYNNANPANMRYEAFVAGDLLRFIAVRGISADEELTINYNARDGGAEWHDTNWFDRMNIKPI